MKFNDRLILTLPDFRQHFNMVEFFKQRHLFIREFAPDGGIVFYWDEKDKDRYNKVKKFIEEEPSWDSDYKKDVSRHQHNEYLIAFAELSGQDIASIMDNWEKAKDLCDFTKDILYASDPNNGNVYNLIPGEMMEEEQIKALLKKEENKNKKERIHKIEVKSKEETKDKPLQIHIGGKDTDVRLYYGDCVYVTEIDGTFVRVLPSETKVGRITFYLCNEPGKFLSELYEEAEFDIPKLRGVCSHYKVNGMGAYQRSDQHYYSL